MDQYTLSKKNYSLIPPYCKHCIERNNINFYRKFPYRSHDESYYMRFPRRTFTTKEAIDIGNKIGVDFTKYDVEQFRMGLDVELEHGSHDPQTNVTNDDPILTGKIAYAHLKEFPDYYTRLAKIESM